MATVRFSRPAEGDLKHLPHSVVEALRTRHVPQLSANPRAGKPLHGPLRGLFSYDFWTAGTSYRMAYSIMHGEVVIIMVDTRDNFYKKLRRRVGR